MKTSQRLRRIAKAVAGAATVGLILTGCSTVSSAPDQRVLVYEGGYSSKTLKDCVPASTRNTYGGSTTDYAYPDARTQRDFTADNKDPNREADSLLVWSKDNQEVFVPVTVTFNLNTDCSEIKEGGTTYKGGVFQLFHEKHGLGKKAYWDVDEEGDARSDGVPKGWITLLQKMIGTPLDRTADTVARGFDWKPLTQDPSKRAEMEVALQKVVQAEVDAQMGAPAGRHFFENLKIIVGTPTPKNEGLLKANNDEQTAVANANTAKKKAEADVIAAQAQVAVASAEAAAKKAELDALGPDVYLKLKALEKNITPWPNPIAAPAAAAPAGK